MAGVEIAGSSDRPAVSAGGDSIHPRSRPLTPRRYPQRKQHFMKPTEPTDEKILDTAAAAMIWNPGSVSIDHGKHLQNTDYLGRFLITPGRKERPVETVPMGSGSLRRPRNVTMDYKGSLISGVDAFS